MARACTLVEMLKDAKICVVTKISTNVHSEPFFTEANDVRWTPPVPIITFRISRGELAQSLSEYQQIKMSEIFEKFDAELTGFVSFDAVESMKIAERFHATKDMIDASQAFLATKDEQRLNLPDFLRYAEMLISPMLEDRSFKKIIAKQFDVSVAVEDSSSDHHNTAQRRRVDQD